MGLSLSVQMKNFLNLNCISKSLVSNAINFVQIFQVTKKLHIFYWILICQANHDRIELWSTEVEKLAIKSLKDNRFESSVQTRPKLTFGRPMLTTESCQNRFFTTFFIHLRKSLCVISCIPRENFLLKTSGFLVVILQERVFSWRLEIL